MNYKLNYMCLKRGVSLILGHGVVLSVILISRFGYCFNKHLLTYLLT